MSLHRVITGSPRTSAVPRFSRLVLPAGGPAWRSAIAVLLGLGVLALAALSAPRDPVLLGAAGVGLASLVVAGARQHLLIRREVDALRTSESRHRTLLASIPQHVIVKDRDLVFRSINRAVALDLGMDAADVVGKTDYDLYPAELAEAYQQTDLDVMQTREPRTLVERNVSAVGDQLVEVTKAPILEGDGSVSGVMILYEDVTDRVAAEEARLLLSSVVDTANDAIYTLAPDGTVRTWNRAAERLFGVSARAMHGRRMTAFVPPDRRDEFGSLIATALSGARITRHETTALTAGGATVQVELSASPVQGSDGSIAAASVIARDVTERHALLEQLRTAAYRDAVTGLANRALFVDRLRAALASASSISIHVVFLDLDDFKDVNDRHGHPVGDELLRAVGDRLSSNVRAGDVVARFGGDEFAVLIVGALPEAARDVAERICRALQKPFVAGGHRIAIGASVGLADTHGGGVDADELLRRADVALYSAKRSGKGTVEAFAAAESR